MYGTAARPCSAGRGTGASNSTPRGQSSPIGRGTGHRARIMRRILASYIRRTAQRLAFWQHYGTGAGSGAAPRGGGAASRQGVVPHMWTQRRGAERLSGRDGGLPYIRARSQGGAAPHGEGPAGCLTSGPRRPGFSATPARAVLSSATLPSMTLETPGLTLNPCGPAFATPESWSTHVQRGDSGRNCGLEPAQRRDLGAESNLVPAPAVLRRNWANRRRETPRRPRSVPRTRVARPHSPPPLSLPSPAPGARPLPAQPSARRPLGARPGEPRSVRPARCARTI